MNARRTMTVILLFLGLCAVVSVAEAINLPTGAWTIYGNGFAGVLNITAVDGSGNLALTAYSNPTVGFYSSTSNTIQFTRQFGSTPDSTQTYTGALQLVTKSPGLCTYVLTGTFTGYAPSGASASKPVLGWLALLDNIAC